MTAATAERPPFADREEFDWPSPTPAAIQNLPVAPMQGQSVALAQIHAELDTQVATAKQYPRNAAKAIEVACQMATWNRDVAESCIYAKPVGNKVIRGCSIRLAEIMVSTWGNIRVQPRIVEMDQRFVTVECEVWDLESNVKSAWVCRRRLTDKYGKPYPENVVENTIAAATAIAMRNATFKVIPKAYADIVYEMCAKIIVGDAKSLAEKRDRAIAELVRLGVQEPRILAFLGVKSRDLVDGDMLVTLRGIGNAIRDGEVIVEDAFPDPAAAAQATANAETAKARGTAGVKEKLARQAAAAAAGTAAESAPAPAESSPGPAQPECTCGGKRTGNPHLSGCPLYVVPATQPPDFDLGPAAEPATRNRGPAH